MNPTINHLPNSPTSKARPATALRIVAGLILAATAMTYLAACETTEGAGRDIKKLGNNIEDKAQENK